MEYLLLNRSHTQELTAIKELLSQDRKEYDLWLFQQNFNYMIPKDSMEPIFAVAVKHKVPMIVYSIHKEHKLTRGLSTVYHAQKVYEEYSKEFQQVSNERKKFDGWLVSALKDGYKILGFNCGEGVFAPHQKYMNVSHQHRPSL